MVTVGVRRLLPTSLHIKRHSQTHWIFIGLRLVALVLWIDA